MKKDKRNKPGKKKQAKKTEKLTEKALKLERRWLST